jgi:transmembrane 9 superfamily protein 2/4
VKVSQLSSIKTQLPYSYYSLPFCRPDAVVDSAENLGELLRGDRIENTPYVVSIQHACLLWFSDALNTHDTLNFCSSR